MSIIDSNRRRIPQWHDDKSAARARAIDTMPRKRDLREMLAEAARNTAAMQEGEER